MAPKDPGSSFSRWHSDHPRLFFSDRKGTERKNTLGVANCKIPGDTKQRRRQGWVMPALWSPESTRVDHSVALSPMAV